MATVLRCSQPLFSRRNPKASSRSSTSSSESLFSAGGASGDGARPPAPSGGCGRPEDRRRTVHEAAVEAMEAVDSSMSTYLEDSEISRLNRHPEASPLAV